MRISVSLGDGGYEHVARVISNCKVATFVYADAFNKIVKSGTYNNTHHTGIKNDDNDNAILKRKNVEEHSLFGTNSIYGMLVNSIAIHNELTGKGFGYGNIALVWKDDTKSKALAVLGDSIFLNRDVGNPTINLHYGVTGRQVQHWLAQYKIYDGTERTFFDQYKGDYKAKVNLSKFNVDFGSLKNAIGKHNSQFVEVVYPKPLSFPYDFECIVVDNVEWCKKLKRFGAIMLNDYED